LEFEKCYIFADGLRKIFGGSNAKYNVKTDN